MVLMIDNHDSFTFNVVQYLRTLGAEVKVVSNDQHPVAELAAMDPDYLVVSPGPCTPNEAGVSLQAIDYFAGRIPVLGICLGHQAVGQVFGARVVRAGSVMHGKTSTLYHTGQGVFSGLAQGYSVVRYHSLVLESATLPECFDVTAWTSTEAGEREEIMGIRHRTLNVQGVQFHPESILTEQGHELLNNFLTGAGYE